MLSVPLMKTFNLSIASQMSMTLIQTVITLMTPAYEDQCEIF